VKSETWLLLLYGLPANRNTARVSLWRKLKKFGAVPLKTSAYLLPDEPVNYERVQWLAKQIQDEGGEATLIRVAEIEGLSHTQIIQLFNNARAEEYKGLMESLRRVLDGRKKFKGTEMDLEKFHRRFIEIKEIDYFNSPIAHDAQMLLDKAGKTLAQTPGGKRPQLDSGNFQGKTWLTRPRPEVDRVGSAWLIRRFIDLRAKFVFAAETSVFPEAIPFDMFGVEFSHHGDDCTFETLVKRFQIKDKAVRQIAEMVHDTDLEDGKFQRFECLGIDRILKGWAKSGLTDEQLLKQGGECFEALYQQLRK
jgi:hypothetical protein